MILFTADLHIKIGQEGVPADWVQNRFTLFEQQLLAMISNNNVTLLIVGGDLLDRVPSGKNGVKEVALLLHLVSILPVRTLIYSGNHEAITKSTTFLSDFKHIITQLNPLVSVIDDFYTEEYFDIIPYNRLKSDDKGKYPEFLNKKLLFTHVRGAIPPHVLPEVPLDRFKKWELVIAGDLHSYENCQDNILYPGSPYTTSFHRSKVKTGAILLDETTLKHKWLTFELPQMLRKTVSVGEDMPEDSYDIISYEVEGNIIDLSGITDKTVIKKLQHKKKDTALILRQGMSILEELREYLLYVNMLEPNHVDSLLLEYSDINPEAQL